MAKAIAGLIMAPQADSILPFPTTTDLAAMKAADKVKHWIVSISDTMSLLSDCIKKKKAYAAEPTNSAIAALNQKSSLSGWGGTTPPVNQMHVEIAAKAPKYWAQMYARANFLEMPLSSLRRE